MTDWKKTDYGVPKTWKELREERIDADLAKNSANPMPKLIGLGMLAVVVIACLIGFLLSFR